MKDDDTKPSRVVDRRDVSRERQTWQPHPDLVKECAGVAEFYGVDLGPFEEDVIRRILAAAAAWQERQAAEEREHARLRDMASVAARVAAHQNGGK